jgi:predicted DNA-binding transcriptional regulator AlpA
MQTLMTRQEAADYLGLTKQYLDVLASKKRGPAFFKIASRAVRYDLNDITAWLAEHRVVH